MFKEENFYPYNPNVWQLPFFMTGIGASDYQEFVSRKNGYHWHQLLYCTGGSGILRCEDKEYQINEGCYFLLPKNVPHEYYPTQKKWGIRWVAFDGVSCEDVFEKFAMSKFAPTLAYSEDKDNMENIFEKMCVSVKSDILYCDYTCAGLVFDYLIEFHRLSNHTVSKNRSRRVSMLVPVLTYIDKNFTHDFAMTELSDLVSITPQHLCKIFKETFNCTPGQYILNKRIEYAKRLIRDNEHQISEISYLCGFSDPGYFSTVFKKAEGISPMRYRFFTM